MPLPCGPPRRRPPALPSLASPRGLRALGFLPLWASSRPCPQSRSVAGGGGLPVTSPAHPCPPVPETAVVSTPVPIAPSLGGSCLTAAHTSHLERFSLARGARIHSPSFVVKESVRMKEFFFVFKELERNYSKLFFPKKKCLHLLFFFKR